MAGYTKLFNSILASTIWRADDKTRLVWITMLAMADKHGIIEGSVPGLADFARVSLADCLKALQALQAPDEYSRSKVFDGRRIEPIDGGWKLVNHGKYRAKMGADERREYVKLKQREYRKKNSQQTLTNVDSVSRSSTVLTHTTPEAEADTDPKAIEKATPSLPPAGRRAPITSLETDENAERAGRLVERYGELYQKHRHGARHRSRPNLDWTEACDLVKLWDDARLDKLAGIVLTTDDPWISGTDRAFRIFALKASWADDRLRAWEIEHGITT